MTTSIKKRTRAEAKKLMWEYYRDNKKYLPKWIRKYREDILAGLMAGLTLEAVFTGILECVDSDTPADKAA